MSEFTISMEQIRDNHDKWKERRCIVDELVHVLNVYESGKPLISCQGQGMDGYSALAEFLGIARRARDISDCVVPEK